MSCAELSASELISQILLVNPQGAALYSTDQNLQASCDVSILSTASGDSELTTITDVRVRTGSVELFGHKLVVIASDDHRTTALAQHRSVTPRLSQVSRSSRSKSGIVAQAVPFGTIIVLFHFPARFDAPSAVHTHVFLV